MSENTSLDALSGKIISIFEMKNAFKKVNHSQDFVLSVSPSTQCLGSVKPFLDSLTKVRKTVGIPVLGSNSDITSLESVVAWRNVGKPMFRVKSLDPYTTLVGILCLRHYFSSLKKSEKAAGESKMTPLGLIARKCRRSRLCMRSPKD